MAPSIGSTSLQTALNRSVDQLDGYPHPEVRPPPCLLPVWGRSRSPLRDPPVPRDERGLMAVAAEDRRYRGFLAKRFKKKKRQVGAHREINFNTCDPKTRAGLILSRKSGATGWISQPSM